MPWQSTWLTRSSRSTWRADNRPIPMSWKSRPAATDHNAATKKDMGARGRRLSDGSLGSMTRTLRLAQHFPERRQALPVGSGVGRSRLLGGGLGFGRGGGVAKRRRAARPPLGEELGDAVEQRARGFAVRGRDDE